MSDQTPHTHHYIPSFYLRQWAGTDKQVCEYRKVFGGKVVTRRCAPESTGYEKDLYGARSDVEIETLFMKPMDTKASRVLQELLQSDDRPLTHPEHADWTQFLLSLRFRTPKEVELMKTWWKKAWEAGLRNPATSEEYTRASPAAAQKVPLIFLKKLIDNKGVEPIIRGMNWSVVSLKRSEISLLTSDRPLDMPLVGLANTDAYITLPLGPDLLFFAERDSHRHQKVHYVEATATDAKRLVKESNRFVVEAAHEFVWGLDDSQLRFVRNRMGQRKAIDVALASGLQHSE